MVILNVRESLLSRPLVAMVKAALAGDSNVVAVIKAVRQEAGADLKEAKDFVDSVRAGRVLVHEPALPGGILIRESSEAVAVLEDEIGSGAYTRHIDTARVEDKPTRNWSHLMGLPDADAWEKDAFRDLPAYHFVDCTPKGNAEAVAARRHRLAEEWKAVHGETFRSW